MKRGKSTIVVGALCPVFLPLLAGAAGSRTLEFCLNGEFDLGDRLQGMEPKPGEFSAARTPVSRLARYLESEACRAAASRLGRLQDD